MKTFLKKYHFIYYIIFIWIISFIGFFSNIKIGILPRNTDSLIGIISSPFFHADFFHLLFNTISFFIFSFIYNTLENEKIHFPFWFIQIISALGIWIFARNGNHIGLSNVIFGLYGYLLFVGLIIKKLKYIFISLFILIIYGTFIFGIFPLKFNVSFEGHLFGLIAGIILAYLRKESLK